jgi:hypothetical protein
MTFRFERSALWAAAACACRRGERWARRKLYPGRLAPHFDDNLRGRRRGLGSRRERRCSPAPTPARRRRPCLSAPSTPFGTTHSPTRRSASLPRSRSRTATLRTPRFWPRLRFLSQCSRCVRAAAPDGGQRRDRARALDLDGGGVRRSRSGRTTPRPGRDSRRRLIGLATRSTFSSQKHELVILFLVVLRKMRRRLSGNAPGSMKQ